MPIDPNTGMYSLDVNYQPTGAMGAVINLLNSQKANEIAQTLQQQRAAQAQMDQQRADEFAAAEQRAEQARRAVAAAGPDPQKMAVAYAQSGGDLKDVAPLMRTGVSSGARLGEAEIKARAATVAAMTKAGMSPTNALAMGTMNMSEDDAKAVQAQVLGMMSPGAAEQPAPVPGAIVGEKQAKTALETAQAQRIADMTPAEQQLLMSKSGLARAEAAYYAIRRQVEAANPKDPYFAVLLRRSAAKEREIDGLVKSNAVTLFQEPGAMERLTKLQAEQDDLDKLIDQKMAQLKQSTSGGGSTTTTPPAAGTSSTPAPTTKTLVFPP